MSRLEEMSVEDILDYIGMYLTSNDFRIIVDYNQEVISKLVKRTDENQRKIKNRSMLDRPTAYFVRNTQIDDEERLLNEFNIKAFREILSAYESKVNKGCLVLLTLYNIQRNLEEENANISVNERETLKKERTRAMALLGKSNVNAVSLEYKKEEGIIEKVNVIKSKELIKCIKSNQKINTLFNPDRKKLSRLEEIDKKIGISNLTHALNILDITEVACTENEIGSSIRQQVYYNLMQKYKKNHPEIDFKKMTDKGNIPEEMQKTLLASDEYNDVLIQTIKANCKYLDIDKLLLSAAFRYIELLEMGREDDIYAVARIGSENQQTLTHIQIIELLVRLIESEIKKDVSIEYVSSYNGDKIKYSLDNLKEDLGRFTQDRYIKKSDCASTKQKLISGKVTFKNIDINEIRFIRIRGDEIGDILKASDDNMFYCIENGLINKEDMYDLLTLLGKCSKEVFAEIIKRKLIEPDEIEKLFNEGIIEIEHIRTIEDDEMRKSLNNVDKLRQLYMTVSNTKKEATPEEREQFIKYVELYKALNIESRSEEEVKKASFNLISSFEGDLDSDILQGLYQYGLITLEDAADWGVDLREMLSSNSIKPTDLKDLYAKRIIDIDSIKSVIVNNDALPYEEKLDLIYSTFDGESEEEYMIREELVQLLEEKDSYRAESSTKRDRQARQSRPKSKEYVTDPHARWKLISTIDKDYSKKFLPTGKEVKDGHRVFLLPNQNSIVIERMHERKNGRKVSAYANATYIMETDEFFKNMDDIIIDGAINRTALREFSEEDKATKIVHSKGWGTSIKNYFSINEENDKYTKQDIEEIDKAIESVNKSRKERT